MFNRRRFLQATPALLAAALARPAGVFAAEDSATPPVIGRSSRTLRSGDGRATLDIGSRQSLRILQVTDNHFFCGVKEGLIVTRDDRATVRDWKAFVRIFRPDLVVATGDLWHDNPGGRGQGSLETALRRLEQLDVPWATCWGNHDQLDDYQAGHDALEGARNSRYRGGATHGDYHIDVVSGSGTSAAARLWLLNTHQFGLTEWQLAWLRRTRAQLAATGAASVPSLGFYHIPLLEQKTLYRPKVTPGLFHEDVCHEREAGVAAPVLAADDRLRACFCGHDHVNDYTVRTQSLDLVYGRATGHGGYGGETVRKGAKLIELDLRTGQYTQVTVFADGTRWIAG